MKRNLILAGLCLLCALLLIGCGGSAPAASAPSAEPSAPLETAAPAEETPTPAEETPAPAAATEPAASSAPVATLPDAGLVRDTQAESSETDKMFELAKSYIDKPLSELQAEIGEPASSSYVSSCLVPGGEDGELHYDGFTVYTVKSGDTETVLDVLTD